MRLHRLKAAEVQPKLIREEVAVRVLVSSQFTGSEV